MYYIIIAVVVILIILLVAFMFRPRAQPIHSSYASVKTNTKPGKTIGLIMPT